MSTIDIDEDEYDNLSYSDEDVREVMEKDESSSDEESDEEDGIERAHLDHEYCELISIMELESGNFGESSMRASVRSLGKLFNNNNVCLSPDTPLHIKIVEATYQPKSHRLNPYLYTIELTHGEYQWRIRKRFNRFQHLYAHLGIARAAILIHERSYKSAIKVPKLPHRPEIAVKESHKEKRMARLEKFLQRVVDLDVYRNNKHTLYFFEISLLSLMKDLGGKEKEGEVFKRVGGHMFTKGVLGIQRFDPTWHKSKDNDEIREVMLFDSKFKVSCDPELTGIDKGLLISNSSRNLIVQCYSDRIAREWMVDIMKLMAKNEYIEETRFESFAPLRENADVKWYVDGKDYFSDVADGIMMAKEEIFITDWWLSPEIQLKRSLDSAGSSRLDQLLKQQADKGVKIYVLLYKEIEVSLGINSLYSKQTLLNLNSENIKILRHPDHVGATTVLLWAHHEKIVCIDQRMCFLGGFDLCFGRWDDHKHRLTDFGSVQPNFFSKMHSTLVKLGGHAALFDTDELDRSNSFTSQKLNSPNSFDKLFVGKDYTNPYIADVCDVEKPFVDYLDRNIDPRMPWHDIACVVFGDAARDAGRHFIQRWNFTKQQKAKETHTVPFLLPKIVADNHHLYAERINNVNTCNVQILRSSSTWSCGSDVTDKSILNAYLENIANAKHYIYIENQFFITSLQSDDGYSVDNCIGDKLVERITRAHEEGEVFRVFVVMPLLPSFPGEIGEPAAAATCVVENWNLRSSRHIINQLKDKGIVPEDYICFCGLRNFADLRSRKVTEIVYVHSKLMIVDDRVVIMGSANINDRSMLGERDSEIAVCVEDRNMVTGTMNGIPVTVGSFAYSLRVQLFKEHLGLLDSKPEDIAKDVVETNDDMKSASKPIVVTQPIIEHFNDPLVDFADSDSGIKDEIEIDTYSLENNHQTQSTVITQSILNDSNDHPVDFKTIDSGSKTHYFIGIASSSSESNTDITQPIGLDDSRRDDSDFSNQDVFENINSSDSNNNTTQLNSSIELNESVVSDSENRDCPKTQDCPETQGGSETQDGPERTDCPASQGTSKTTVCLETQDGPGTQGGSETQDGSERTDFPASQNTSETQVCLETQDGPETQGGSETNFNSPENSNTTDQIGTINLQTSESPSEDDAERCVLNPLDRHCTPRPCSLIDVTDPICEHFYKNVWIHTAKQNMEIYEEVFKCLPTNEVKSFDDIPAYKQSEGLERSDPVRARTRLKDIRGHLVEKPLEFLCNQNLMPDLTTKEGLVPYTVFT